MDVQWRDGGREGDGDEGMEMKDGEWGRGRRRRSSTYHSVPYSSSEQEISGHHLKAALVSLAKMSNKMSHSIGL